MCYHLLNYQPAPLLAINKSCSLTFFGHLAWMDENADARQAIFEPPPENWRRPGWRTLMMTCHWWILGYMRLEIRCKIGLSGDWYLCTVLRTRSGACYYWIECPCQQQLLTRNGELTAKTFSTAAYTVYILLDDKHFQLWIWPNIS